MMMVIEMMMKMTRTMMLMITFFYQQAITQFNYCSLFLSSIQSICSQQTHTHKLHYTHYIANHPSIHLSIRSFIHSFSHWFIVPNEPLTHWYIQTEALLSKTVCIFVLYCDYFFYIQYFHFCSNISFF